MNPWIPKFRVLRISRYFSWSKIGRFGIRDRWKYMMNSYINWVFNSSSQLALLPVPLMPMSMFEDKAMTGYRSIIFRKSYCIHTFKKTIFEKKGPRFPASAFPVLQSMELLKAMISGYLLGPLVNLKFSKLWKFLSHSLL